MIDPAMILLQPKLVTSFHWSLADARWVTDLEAFVTERVRASAAFRTLDGSGTLRADYNEDRFMGPQSVVKYHFQIEAQISRGDANAPHDAYQASIEYDPEAGRFSCRNEWISTQETRARDAEEMRLRREAERLACPTLESFSQFQERRCPDCAAPLRAGFYPEGSAWAYECSRDRAHVASGWLEVKLEPGGWWTDHILDRRCPGCGTADAVTGILYGLLRDVDDLDRKAWTQGGCSVGPEKWHCRSCNRGF
jgi:hypothetical protein